jgi:hypothetical protein
LAHWTELFDRDLHVYVRNLRKAEVPEETVQDIILAEVNRLFAPREAQLQLKPEQRKPWEADSALVRSLQERQEAYLTLQKEKQTLVGSLLGIRIPVTLPERSRSRSRSLERALAQLREEKREAVQEIQERFSVAIERVQTMAFGFFEQEDRQEYLQVKSRRKSALAEVLTAQELENFELALSGRLEQLPRRLPGFDGTEHELRIIARAEQAFTEQFEFPGNVEMDSSYQLQQQEGIRAREAALQAGLGATRYADYRRSTDSRFRQIYQLGRSGGLDKATLVAAYETVKRVQQSMNSSSTATADVPVNSESVRQAKEKKALEQLELRRALGDQVYEILSPALKSRGNHP